MHAAGQAAPVAAPATVPAAEAARTADAGASASLSLTNTARLYVNYDAKLRAAMQSHQGTLGLELRW